MGWATNALTSGITNSMFSMKGVSYPNEFSIPESDTTVNESYGIEMSGPISFTLPWGVEIQDWNSTSGNLKVTEDGGRQTVTYVIPPGTFSDDISYTIHVSWMYFLVQFWIYPTIVILLLVLFIRRRRRKKKAKKNRLKQRESNINKAQLGDSEFSDLVGFSSPGLRRGESIEDMASIDDY
jgi:ATP-dependent Zn protease